MAVPCVSPVLGWVRLYFCGLWPGAREGSIGSGTDFKASQKMGSRLKVSLTDWDSNLVCYLFCRRICFLLHILYCIFPKHLKSK